MSEVDDVPCSAVLLELLRSRESVIVDKRHVDERSLCGLLTAALNESPALANECLGLKGRQYFRDGTNKEPDILGYEQDDQKVSLIEVKTGLNLFNWSSGKDQLTRYRESSAAIRSVNRVLVLPARLAESIRADNMDKIDRNRADHVNIPYDEIHAHWRMVTWERIGDWLSTNIRPDSRVEPVLPAILALLRVR
ncbi:hypothetical protein [Kocuria palustris]|uniref:hypothetical protein n=1 Tax=Kocuria palustris TaxID=71999 RepID=UPI0012E737BC|nr:hypothetical protein [Kocuria palustris]